MIKKFACAVHKSKIRCNLTEFIPFDMCIFLKEVYAVSAKSKEQRLRHELLKGIK